MKKIILSVALLAAVGMTSCGKKTACDCKKERLALLEEGIKAMDDADKMKDIETIAKEYETKSKALEESCKDFTQEDYEKCD